jgi:excisionase family DNA binding protein
MNLELPDSVLEEIAQRAAEILLAREPSSNGNTPSPYLTIVEAAELLRSKRHRVDDLLSRGTLTRIKDGTRTLVARAELEDYLAGKPTGRGRR